MYQTRRIYPRSTATGSAWQVGKGVIFQFESDPASGWLVPRPWQGRAQRQGVKKRFLNILRPAAGPGRSGGNLTLPGHLPG